MKAPTLHRLLALIGLESNNLDSSQQQTFANAFPTLDPVSSQLLRKWGRMQAIYSGQLVFDASEKAHRICLLLDGSIIIERPGVREIQVLPGVLWNHLTWSPRGKRVNGCRLYAGKSGATVVEWNGKILGKLIEDNPELHRVLTDGVMRCVGLNHELTLEKTTFVAPASLRRDATLSELMETGRPIFVADNDDEFTMVGHAADLVGAHRKVSATHPGTNYDVKERTKGFYFARAMNDQRAVS